MVRGVEKRRVSKREREKSRWRGRDQTKSDSRREREWRGERDR